MNKLILASKSPRRKELLGMLNIPFDIVVADIDETIDYNNDLVKEIENLSYRKAKAVFDKYPDAIVIGSDTIVRINNEVLGKPKSKEDAKDMIRKLSNNTHDVVTGVTILSKDHEETFSSIASVTFYEVSEQEIEYYVNTCNLMDKAGAYAIQEDAGKFIKEIHGDYYTIVGLPIGEVYHRLKKYL